MDMITLSHRGRAAALAAPARVWFATHMETLPDGHPDKRLICFMAFYARDILTGAIPGPYTDRDAQDFAIACLIPTELLEREDLDVDRVAAGFRVPVEALQHAHAGWPHGDAATWET